MTDSCKYRLLFYTPPPPRPPPPHHTPKTVKKKSPFLPPPPPQAYLPKMFPKVNKTALLSWQIHVQKYPEEVEKNWLKTCLRKTQNLCRNCFNLHNTTIFNPTISLQNLTNERSINRIVKKTFVCLFVCLFGFFVPLENFSIIQRCHLCRWRASILTHARHTWPLNSEGSLACHTMTRGIRL